eukprot:jgi/Ulvmu1/8691/UM047_0031.1
MTNSASPGYAVSLATHDEYQQANGESHGSNPNHCIAQNEQRQCTADQYVPEGVFRLFRCLGVRRKALLSWAIIHEQPHLALAFSMSTGALAIIIFTYSMFASTPWRWIHHGPALGYSACHIVMWVSAWFGGLPATKNKLYCCLLIACVALQFQAAIRLMMGPIGQVPFHNRLLYTCVNAMGLACWTMSSVLGLWPPDHPPAPFRSFFNPCADTAVRTLRFSDAITDMLIIRLMLEQAKQYPCFWFGEQAACSKWIIMSGFAGIFVVLDLAAGLFLAIFGSGVGRAHISPSMKSWFVLAHVVSLLCEAGIMIVTLIQLISELEGPMADSRSNRASAILLTVASFLTTVTTFSISVIARTGPAWSSGCPPGGRGRGCRPGGSGGHTSRGLSSRRADCLQNRSRIAALRARWV